MERDEIVHYWPKNKPIPKGWEFAATLGNGNHGHYSILIKKTGEGNDFPLKKENDS
jgi:hypothetical protein|tara:strand:- start:3890 stop:4057 length:168 start_codon:yes stop_codon:yes gene_type:complete